MVYEQDRLKHFKEAVQSRYGITLSPEDIVDIYKQIDFKEATKLRDVLAGKQEWEVLVKNPLRQSIKVIYNPKIKLLITALPCSAFNHKPVNAKRNRQKH